MQSKTDIILEGSRATWIMPPTDGELGGTYTGQFEFVCYLTPTQQLQAGREFRELLGSLGAMASEVESNLSFALTQLKVRIIKAPPFWTSTQQESGIAGNVGDLKIIALVLDKAIYAENLYKEKIALEREAVLARSIKVVEDRLKTEQKETEEAKE